MKVLTVIGARPQFIKAAPVHAELQARAGVDEVLVHTGQHYDDAMSAVFFEQLELPEPAFNLGINRCSHGRMTGRMMEALESVIEQERPNRVLVYGDTNSTLAGALVAAKLDIPVAHVEAGLRSFNRQMPEEINRVLTDQVSDLLFCPTTEAVGNLAREGIETGVHHTGDVMYDAALFVKERAASVPRIVEGAYVVATVHRAENTRTREALARVVAYLEDVAKNHTVVWPLHPRTRQCVEEYELSLGQFTICAPLGYVEMVAAVSRADAVYTDSGGLQKEAYFHRVPCVTLRGETEWVETVDAGWNRLWTCENYRAERRDIDEYGEGNAAAMIVDLLVSGTDA